MTISPIEWTDRSDWNPVRGCSRVTEGCRNCYAENIAARFSGPGLPFEGFAHRVGGEARWTGKVELQLDRLKLPLKWRKPVKIFVNSTSDIFHEKLSDSDIDQIFAVMALASYHTFQILTKRPDRMREYFDDPNTWGRIIAASDDLKPSALWNGNAYQLRYEITTNGFLPNVWLGVSVHDQASADEFIPPLLDAPSAVRFVSYEPALGPINFTRIGFGQHDNESDIRVWIDALRGGDWSLMLDDDGEEFGVEQGSFGPKIHQIIYGGESGPNARSSHPAWPRWVRDQCAVTGTAFYFKQWGEWMPYSHGAGAFSRDDPETNYKLKAEHVIHGQERSIAENLMIRVGKKIAGNHLDGKQHLEFPPEKTT